MDIGQPVVAALVPESEALVIDAQLLHEGGVEVVDGDFVAQDGVGEVVGLAVDQARQGPRPATRVVKQLAWWSRP